MNDPPDIGGDLEAMIEDMLAPIVAFGEMGQQPPENVKAVVAIRLLVRSQALLSTSVKLMDDTSFASSIDLITEHTRELRSLIEIEMERIGQPDVGESVDAILVANSGEERGGVDVMQDRWFMTVMALIENMVAGVETSNEG